MKVFELGKRYVWCEVTPEGIRKKKTKGANVGDYFVSPNKDVLVMRGERHVIDGVEKVGVLVPDHIFNHYVEAPKGMYLSKSKSGKHNSSGVSE